MTSDGSPGASASISASMRSANASVSVASHLPSSRAAVAVARGVATRLARHVRVRPHRLGTRRRAGGVGLVHLADEHERVRGDAVLPRGRRAYAVTRSMLSQRWTVPARVAASARHGIGPDNAQSTLNVAWSYWKRSRSRTHRRREVLLADEVAVQRGRADVGEHAARRVDRLAVGEHDRDGAPVAHLDRAAPGVARHRTTAARSRRRTSAAVSSPGAALGDREAVLLAEAR